MVATVTLLLNYSASHHSRSQASNKFPHDHADSLTYAYVRAPLYGYVRNCTHATAIIKRAFICVIAQ